MVPVSDHSIGHMSIIRIFLFGGSISQEIHLAESDFARSQVVLGEISFTSLNCMAQIGHASKQKYSAWMVMHFYGKNIFEKTTCFSKSRMNTTHPDQSIHPLTSFKHGSQTLNLHLPRWLFVGSAIDLQPTPWQKTYFLKGICVFFLLYIKQT